MVIVNVCTSEYGGGAEKIASTLVISLTDVQGVVSRGIYFSGAVENPNSVSFNLDNPRNPIAILLLIRVLWKLKKIHKELIVHAHLSWPFYYCVIASLFVRVNLVYTEHHTSNKRRKFKLLRYLDRLVYSQYDSVIAISKGVLGSLGSWVPLKNLKEVRVIYNGVKLSKFNYKHADNKKSLKLLSIGRLAKVKGFDCVINSMNLLPDDIDVQYEIAGAGSEYSTLQELIMQLDLTKNVRLLGHVLNVEDLLNSTDVFLVPSLNEGFGLVVVEAMSSGVPVIASDIPGLREIVDIGDYGNILVENNRSPSAWSQAIIDMCYRVGRDRKELSLRCRRKSEVFSVDRMVNGYVDLYKEIFNEKVKLS